MKALSVPVLGHAVVPIGSRQRQIDDTTASPTNRLLYLNRQRNCATIAI